MEREVAEQKAYSDRVNSIDSIAQYGQLSASPQTYSLKVFAHKPIEMISEFAIDS